MYLIREMPAAERPRERLLKYGAENLGTHELLAILLRTGTKDLSVLEVAKDVLFDAGSAAGLREKTIPGVRGEKRGRDRQGDRPRRGARTRKRALQDDRERPKILSARDVFSAVKDELMPLKQEEVVMGALRRCEDVPVGQAEGPVRRRSQPDGRASARGQAQGRRQRVPPTR
ncbi:MAG: hypothetical protein MZU97_11160 [Bacillus subtilis]|nr:hypothetical protein [Bacillus subtilis]